MKHTLFLTLCLACSITLHAQTATLNYPTEIVNGQKVYLYPVEKGIGLYRVSVNFGVSQEEIIKWNPQLKERGLRFEEIIRIPVNQTAKPEPAPATESAPQEVSLREQIHPVVEPVVAQPKIQQKAQAAVEVKLQPVVPEVQPQPAEVQPTFSPITDDTLRIAILLPFCASSSKQDASVEKFIEFYEGTMLAIYTAQQAGQKFEIYVYDTEKSNAEIQQLIHDGKLNRMNAIIGPTYPTQVATISDFVKQARIPTFVPFTNQIDAIETNPFLIQFNPSDEQETDALVSYLQAKGTTVNCVLMDAAEADMPHVIRLLRNAILTADIPNTSSSIHRILADSIAQDLVAGVENVLIFNTEKYNNLQVLMPHLTPLKERYDITILGRYSWQKETNPFPQLFTSVFDTEIEADRSEYEALYAQYFNLPHTTDMPRYDLLGYDITRQVIATLLGKEYFGLQSDILFEQVNAGGGQQNTHIHIIKK
ncbi:MAG: ABC transporter substrate-binding protein [Paludibacteraceae bacterium]|nr:ABC transporter substrate-binding protein [Paludibacteraceae bacterium]